jgi:hypothetical protein
MRLALCVLLLLAQCSAGKDALYAGMVRPVAGTCNPAMRATLSLYGSNVQFAPTSGVVVLEGSLREAGRIEANLERSGIDRQPEQFSLHATLREGVVAGDYITPRCHYTVELVPGN